ncbi:MAG TPA: pitrilysin family protein [Longimicrobiales bacterium]|nr:pitrilysin family protein [Longimicrobiales bacterium]
MRRPLPARAGALPLATLLATAVALVSAPVPAIAQDTRSRLEALEFERLRWDPPVPERREIDGVTVFLLEDHTLPLVTLAASFRGGYAYFDREWYAAATALPALLRYGGTTDLPPDSVDELIEFHALQTTFGTGGASISSSLDVLTEQLDVGFALWRDMLARPRFDEEQVELWRERELESLRRRADDPATVAYARFNRLLYGDHPIGWQMTPEDVEPELLSPERLREMHRRIVCREHVVLGAAGDVGWDRLEPAVRELVAALDACPERLPDPPLPDIRREPGVFVLERDLEQAIVIMAHPTPVRLADDSTYFAATIGNSILGAGGLSSRISGRVRTEEGYAYSATSLWTTPRRYDGLIGATTRTRPETAVDAARLILETMEEMRTETPSAQELRTAIDRIVNGFVFNFESAAQIVARTMAYAAQGLPEDWLQRYVDGIQRVDPEDVRRVFAENLHPEQMTILVMGDPERMGVEALASLGPVTTLEPLR